MDTHTIELLNTEWNRKTGILPGKGIVNLLGTKHGIAYFTWTDLEEAITYLQCEELVFKKNFRFSITMAINDMLDGLLAKKVRFLKYPFEVLVK